MSFEWMAWTPVTGGFFIVIALILVAMGIWQAVSPSIERRGFLPMVTTRGDRLFIGLLSSAYANVGWVGLTEWSSWFLLPILVIWIAIVMRFG
jgi:predicted small integral membrane protein